MGEPKRYTVVYDGSPAGARILTGEPAPGLPVTVMLGDLKHEEDRLRDALIRTGLSIGCILGPGVSTDFLMNLPEEARLVMGRARAAHERAGTAERKLAYLQEQMDLAMVHASDLKAALAAAEARAAAAEARVKDQARMLVWDDEILKGPERLRLDRRIRDQRYAIRSLWGVINRLRAAAPTEAGGTGKGDGHAG